MLKSIPLGILTHTAKVKVPLRTDMFGVIEYTDTEVGRVHLQPVHMFRKTKDNKELLLNGMLFWDARKSGAFDWLGAENASAALGAQMKVVESGKTYTVVSIDYLPDDEGKPHHVEVALV